MNTEGHDTLVNSDGTPHTPAPPGASAQPDQTMHMPSEKDVTALRKAFEDHANKSFEWTRFQSREAAVAWYWCRMGFAAGKNTAAPPGISAESLTALCELVRLKRIKDELPTLENMSATAWRHAKNGYECDKGPAWEHAFAVVDVALTSPATAPRAASPPRLQIVELAAIALLTQMELTHPDDRQGYGGYRTDRLGPLLRNLVRALEQRGHRVPVRV